MRIVSAVPACRVTRGKNWRQMFSTKVTDGASSVAEAVDFSADSSAPKKITCITKRHALQHQARAGPAAGLRRSALAACSGMMISALVDDEHGHEGEQDVGDAADHRAARGGLTRLLADITRWNTSCCGMEPSIIVMAAPMKNTICVKVRLGQELEQVLAGGEL